MADTYSAPPLRENIWFAAKPGEERRFVSAKEPTGPWADGLRKEGYRIFRVTFRLPDGWDKPDFVINHTDVSEVNDG